MFVEARATKRIVVTTLSSSPSSFDSGWTFECVKVGHSRVSNVLVRHLYE